MKKIVEWERVKFNEWKQDSQWRRQWRMKIRMEKSRSQNDIERVNQLNRTTQDYRNHLIHLFWEADRELTREFDAWKQEKGQLAKEKGISAWRPNLVNWHKFHLRIKYSWRWKRFVVERRHQRIRRIVDAVGNGHLTGQQAATLVYQTIDNWTYSWSPFRRSIYRKSDIHLTPTRAVLSQREKDEYDRQIRLNYMRSRPRYAYTLLGESYIHGMMDGEAIAHQNRHLVPRAVFEIR